MKPLDYPEAVNLPFNFSSIKSDFIFRTHRTDTTMGNGSWVIIQGNNVILEETDSGLRFPAGKLPDRLLPQHPAITIGTWRDKPLHAVTIDSGQMPEAPLISETFNATEDRIDIQTLTLAGLGKQILHWELQSRHCSRCGEETAEISGNWGKRCTSCGSEHYPHIHPCAIVLVKRGRELLMARKTEWPAGRYGLVAGFLDFGESLEECAVREVREETGIEICNVRYVASQNWPFPAQLMAGFVAEYASGDICVDPKELEDARWFHVDDLPRLPGRRSIARWLIENFK